MINVNSGYSPNSDSLILQIIPPMKQPRGFLIQGEHYCGHRHLWRRARWSFQSLAPPFWKLSIKQSTSLQEHLGCPAAHVWWLSRGMPGPRWEQCPGSIPKVWRNTQSVAIVIYIYILYSFIYRISLFNNSILYIYIYLYIHIMVSCVLRVCVLKAIVCSKLYKWHELQWALRPNPAAGSQRLAYMTKQKNPGQGRQLHRVWPVTYMSLIATLTFGWLERSWKASKEHRV